MLPRQPIETGTDIALNSREIVPVGIVDFGWISVMGLMLGIITYSKSVAPFINVFPPKGMLLVYYETSLETCRFYLGKIIDGILITGGVVSACMAILWAGEIWRKSDEKSRRLYKFSTITSIKIIVAYLVVVLNTAVWLAAPLSKHMDAIMEILKQPSK